jgi:hypothetical protein
MSLAPPYGATVGGVRSLSLDTAAEGMRPNNRAPRLNDDQVSEWIRNNGSTVALRLARLELLPFDRDDALWSPGIITQSDVELSARQAVELLTASQLQDVLHPERVTNGRGFGAALMDRYEKALGDLVMRIDSAIELLGSSGASVAAPAPAGWVGNRVYPEQGLNPYGRGF